MLVLILFSILRYIKLSLSSFSLKLLLTQSAVPSLLDTSVSPELCISIWNEVCRTKASFI